MGDSFRQENRASSGEKPSIMTDGHARKYILAADLGTSGPKSALVSTSGEVVDSAFAPDRLHLLPDGGAEQDPEEWWTSILATFKILLDRRSVPPEDIVAVCCSAQWSGTVAVDDTGRHVGNAMIWLDSRGGPCVQKITDGLVKLEGCAVSKIFHSPYRARRGGPVFARYGGLRCRCQGPSG